MLLIYTIYYYVRKKRLNIIVKKYMQKQDFVSNLFLSAHLCLGMRNLKELNIVFYK